MKVYDFKVWFESFILAKDLFRGRGLTEDEWKQLKAKIEQIDP